MMERYINDGKQIFQTLSHFFSKFLPSLFRELLPSQLNQMKGLFMHIIFTGSQSSLIYCWRFFSVAYDATTPPLLNKIDSSEIPGS